MRRMIEKILRQFGMEVTVNRSGESWTVRAFLQPVLTHGQQNIRREVLALGYVPAGQYTYVGPTEPEIQEGDLLTVGEDTYVLRRAEVIRDAQGPAYCWGMCVRKGGDDTWAAEE